MSTDVKSQETVASADIKTQASDKELNFEKLRKKLEAQEAALQERDAMLRQQQQALQELQSRFQPQDKDEFDSLPADELIDKAKFERALAKEREKLRKEAEAIARETYAKIDSENYAVKLKSLYPDYDQVVTESNAAKLQENEPEYVELLSEVKDNFKRREMAYKKMKKFVNEDKPKVKAQEVVEENRKTSAAYYSPTGQGPMTNPYAFEFDVRSKEAKAQAYAKLKAAQKRA